MIHRAKRGERLAADDVNRLTQAAEQGAWPWAGGGMEFIAGPHGIVIMPPKSPTSGSAILTKGKLTSAATCPMFGVGEIIGAMNTGLGDTILQVQRPLYAGTSRLCVAMEGAAQNDVVWWQTAGLCIARYTIGYASSPPAGDSDGDRLGCFPNSYTLCPDPLGPFMVTMPGPSHNLVYVSLTRQRGDRIYVSTPTPYFISGHVVSTLIWDDTYFVLKNAQTAEQWGDATEVSLK